MGSKKELKDYITNSFSGAGFMSFNNEGIRYIYEVGDVALLDSSTHNARLIGIYAVGVFYSLLKEYDGIGKVFMDDFTAFEQLYNDVFDKQLRRYGINNPIGGKLAMSVDLRLKQFEHNNLQSVASDLIFGNLEMQDKPIDHNYFEPLYLRYLLLGNKSLEDAVKADINEHANELNYMLLSENMAYKRAAEMLRDERMLKKISLYGKIKKIHENNFIITVGFEGTTINNIAVEKEQLLNMIKQNETFTYKGKLIVSFEDISEIKCEEQVIYSG